MGGSFQLARLFGIRIGASPSWFIVLFVMVYGLTGYFQDTLGGSNSTAFTTAVAAAVLFFASIILHELGHALAARRSGITTSGIDLWFFGGLARLDRDTRSPGEEFKVAAAGPAVTALIVVVCGAIALVLSDTGQFFDSARFSVVQTSAPVALLGWLAAINAFLLVFNLVPAFPLDGGRIARAVAWRITGDRHRGTRIAGRLGQGFSYLLIGFGLYLALSSDPFNGVWFMVLGWFLGQGARGAVTSASFAERIDGVTVSDLMDREPLTMPGSTPMAEAQDAFFARYRWPWFPVVDATGRFLGIVDEGLVDGELAAGRPALPVSDALGSSLPGEDRVGATEPLESLLGSEALTRRGALMVVDDADRLVGVVTLEQVRRALAAAAPGHP